ncbi:MAG TPA: UpxY family transcription antiterminator [Terriglobales bacterium]|nr:UpxY family transcription antiterminator [Terriglobales bacterium]
MVMTLLATNNSVVPAAVQASDPAWYAAYTCARHEKRVAQQLKDRGIEYFLPLYRSVRRWKDRKKELELVLFPSYVFVRIELIARLQVLQLPGVVRFVAFDGRPAVLPGTDIEALRNGLSHNVIAEHHPFLNVGRRVKVVYGPLSGAEGILVRRKSESRLVISIEAIMRSIAVEIDEADVLPIS